MTARVEVDGGGEPLPDAECRCRTSDADARASEADAAILDPNDRTAENGLG